MVPRFQLTVAGGPAENTPPLLAPTKVTPVGRVSVSVALLRLTKLVELGQILIV